jgi:hypothetical protein
LKVKIYPIPAAEYFTLEKLPSTPIDRVNLLTNLGQNIRQIELVNGKEQIPVFDLPTGIYHLMFYKDNHFVGSEKFSIQK